MNGKSTTTLQMNYLIKLLEHCQNLIAFQLMKKWLIEIKIMLF